MSLKRLFTKRTVALFITNSRTCPCNFLYGLARDCSRIEPIVVRDLGSHDTLKKLRRVNNASRVLIFAHGNEYPLGFSYRNWNSVSESVVDIEHDWWMRFTKSKTVSYFHVCHGAKIISRNRHYLKGFPKWVSYSSTVDSVHSSYPPIRNVLKRLLNELAINVRSRRSAESLKASIQSAYRRLESDLLDKDLSMPGRTALLFMIGQNLSKLDSSDSKTF